MLSKLQANWLVIAFPIYLFHCLIVNSLCSAFVSLFCYVQLKCALGHVLLGAAKNESERVCRRSLLSVERANAKSCCYGNAKKVKRHRCKKASSDDWADMKHELSSPTLTLSSESVPYCPAPSSPLRLYHCDIRDCQLNALPQDDIEILGMLKVN